MLFGFQVLHLLKKDHSFLVFICLFCFARPDFILRLNGINRVVFPGDSFHDNHSQLKISSLTLTMAQDPEWHVLSNSSLLGLNILESLWRQSSCEQWPDTKSSPVHPALSSFSL